MQLGQGTHTNENFGNLIYMLVDEYYFLKSCLLRKAPRYSPLPKEANCRLILLI